MCLQYWPVSPTDFGGIHIETLDTKTYAYFVIRTIKLTKVRRRISEPPFGVEKMRLYVLERRDQAHPSFSLYRMGSE